MPETTVIASFPNCPYCGASEVISRKAWEKTGKTPPEEVGLRQEITPLEQPVLAAVTVPCIVSIFDICYSCGVERCVRSLLAQLPGRVQMNQGMGDGKKFPPPPQGFSRQ